MCKSFSNFQIKEMKPSDVLIKPILTEKANAQQDKLRRYAFRVAKKANKLEIKKAIESFYGVTVTNVNTTVVPAKSKSKFTKAGVISGRKPSYKKAFVTVSEGDTIDLYSNI
jgi:large subunit ribosomal protein L23